MLRKARLLPIFLLVIPPAIISDYLEKFHMEQLPSYKFDFIKNFLGKFDNFQLIVHVDNATQYLTNRFLLFHQETNSSAVSIFNYEVTDKIFHRPIGFKCLNLVVYSTPIMFVDYLRVKSNVLGSDVVMFMTIRQNFGALEEEYWHMPYLERAGNIFIVNNVADFVDVYSMCFYCGNDTSRLYLLQRARSARVNINTQQLMPRPFNNFRRHQLRVAYIDYFPFVYCQEKTMIDFMTVCQRAIGAEYRLLKLLGAKMNFTIQLVEIANASYADLFARMISGDFDFAIGGLTMTSERKQELHFSNVLRFELIAFIFSYQTPLIDQISTFLNPFAPSFLIGVIGTMLITALFFHYVLGRSRVNLEIISRSLVEQPMGFRFMQRTGHWKIIFTLGGWWLYCMLITIAYKSKLSAFLLNPPVKEIRKLEDLLAEGYSIVLDRSGTNSFMDLFNEREMALIYEEKSVVWKASLCEAIEDIQTSKATIIGEFSRNFYHPNLVCNNAIKNSFSADSPITAVPLSRSAHGWPFKVGIPFDEAIDQNINLISEGGFLDFWTKEALYEKTESLVSRKVLHGKTAIGMRSYLAQFVIYLALISISIVCFLCESFYYRYFKF